MPLQIYEFDNFRVEVAARRLLKDGQVVVFSSRAFDVLVELVRRSGEIVGQTELINAVWHEQAVEPNNLSQAVRQIRRALGDSSKEPRYLLTVPRQGFKFVLPPENNSAAANRANAPADFQTRSFLNAESEVKDSTPAPTIEQSAQIPSLPATPKKNRRWLAAIGLIAAIGIGLTFYFQRENRAKPLSGIRTLAVLPFKSLDQANSGANAKLGMTDALISRLSRSDTLIVLPTNSISRFKSPNQDPIAVGRELNVEAVLDGSVQEEADRTRISLQLVRVSDGKIIWTADFYRNSNDVFDLQEEMANETAKNLLPETSDDTPNTFSISR